MGAGGVDIVTGGTEVENVCCGKKEADLGAAGGGLAKISLPNGEGTEGRGAKENAGRP